MQVFDHVFFILMALAVPVLVYRSARNSGSPGMTRNRNYLRNVIAWLVAPVVLIYKWIMLDRPFSELGLAAGIIDISLLVGISIGIAVAGFVLTKRTQWGQDQLMGAARNRRSLHTPSLPRGPRELGNFALLEVAETTSDELIYRAFIAFYLHTFFGAAVAVPLMILIYVGSEAYRGRAGMTRAAVLGLVNSALLWLSGAIWAGVAVQLGWRAARTAAVVSIWSPGAQAELYKE